MKLTVLIVDADAGSARLVAEALKPIAGLNAF